MGAGGGVVRVGVRQAAWRRLRDGDFRHPGPSGSPSTPAQYASSNPNAPKRRRTGGRACTIVMKHLNGYREHEWGKADSAVGALAEWLESARRSALPVAQVVELADGV